MALYPLRRKGHDEAEPRERRTEPRLGPELRGGKSEVFDTGRKTIVDLPHVKVERLDTHPIVFSKVFKEYRDGKGQRYDYRYWAERENFFLREFLKKQHEFTHVVQARHLISENEAAKQVLTYDAGITIANWLRIKPGYADAATLSHPFQRPDAFLRLIRACLIALRQIHVNRIVHCDIKEDNICIPYACYPSTADANSIKLEFDKLKLIDFAFSIAHAIPLTQILVIDPDERVPYHSRRLTSALRADRRSGCPNAVQQLDYRVDLFSLGYMAEKISAAGLDLPTGTDGRILQDVRDLIRTLKAFDSVPDVGPLPHDHLIAEIDRLLTAMAGFSESQEFRVAGEWTTEEMARGQDLGRKTPLTPVALPLPTPVSLPVIRAPRRFAGLSGISASLLLGLTPILAACGVFLYLWDGNDGVPALHTTLVEKVARFGWIAQTRVPLGEPLEKPTAGVHAAPDIVTSLRSDEDPVFQAALRDLTLLMTRNRAAAAAIAEAISAEYGDALTTSASPAGRSRAFGRLLSMANAGNTFAAQRIDSFEKRYDEHKRGVATSAWWVRGQGTEPVEAARWIEDSKLLAGIGDRPAMLDLAFALGHGRTVKRDRASAVEMYLKVIARSDGADENSAKIRRSAVRGLAAMLNAIVEQRDQDAASRLLPALKSKAESGAADIQYYVGLINECVAQPADLDAARDWYRKAASDPAWKRTAEDKARLLGSWCPGHSI
jgi:serine/threonine protein kinase